MDHKCKESYSSSGTVPFTETLGLGIRYRKLHHIWRLILQVRYYMYFFVSGDSPMRIGSRMAVGIE